MTTLRSQPLQKSLRLYQLRKQFLFRMKLRRVHAPPAPAQPHRMLLMQHLVIHDIFHCIAWNSRMIEDAANNDCIMRRIVMP